MVQLPYILDTELMVGAGHPTLADTLNRALRAYISQSGGNPDANPFSGFLGPVYNVKAYGAKGDGVTDDTAAIQAAINAAPAGARVYASAGNYLLSSPINFPVNKSLTFGGDGPGGQGSPGDGTVFTPTGTWGAGAAMFQLIGTSPARVYGHQLRDFRISGNNNSATDPIGIATSYSNGL